MSGQAALHDIRILDFTWVLAGPYATRLLADFGAEVIKVQPLLPRETDRFSRGYDNTWNRNKLGISLNLNRPEGVALARRLAAKSDCVVENFSPRVMANFGLDYESLKALKPDLIMVSLSAMGGTGPWRDYVGFGPTVQAFSGMTRLTAFPGGPPLGPGTAYADHVSGLYACLALLGALEHRRRTGAGQHVDISQVEAMASLLGDAILDYATTGNEVAGNSSAEAAPHGVYRCQGDRYCAIAVFSDAEWRGLKRALGNPPWAGAERFGTLAGRLRARVEMDRRLADWAQAHTAEAAVAILRGEGVAAGLVQDGGDLAHDPQLRERGFFVELDDPELGKTVSDAAPIRLSADPAHYRRAAPLPGQDNDYVYGELLGMSPEEMAELKRQGVI